MMILLTAQNAASNKLLLLHPPTPPGVTAGAGKTSKVEDESHKEEKKAATTKTTKKKPAVKQKSLHPDPRTDEEGIIQEKAAVLEYLFELRRLNPLTERIAAVAFLYQREMPPTVLIGRSGNPMPLDPKIDPYNFHFYILSKILPGYSPHIIPAHLQLKFGTSITARKLDPGEPLDVNYLNPLLARMLAKLLFDEKKLDEIGSAISISGNSIATGEARIAIVSTSHR